ncbi:hypothetical protein CC78DRAFT_98811 [Lojkania enalia]|uniref:Uncharacterized protein n=1 Tax=Lojkania enalia TaxID=147567 RepID=A0A9P4N1G2_9PLEO|nr:hypothetical protein CC78DRAFT_98811 [Didymosphaeria enalia]
MPPPRRAQAGRDFAPAAFFRNNQMIPLFAQNGYGYVSSQKRHRFHYRDPYDSGEENLRRNRQRLKAELDLTKQHKRAARTQRPKLGIYGRHRSIQFPSFGHYSRWYEYPRPRAQRSPRAYRYAPSITSRSTRFWSYPYRSMQSSFGTRYYPTQSTYARWGVRGFSPRRHDTRFFLRRRSYGDEDYDDYDENDDFGDFDDFDDLDDDEAYYDEGDDPDDDYWSEDEDSYHLDDYDDEDSYASTWGRSYRGFGRF